MSNDADSHARVGFGADSDSGAAEKITTVLIVDDHRSFADLLEAALGSVEGLRCLGTASTAEEGIRRVESCTRRWW